MIATAPRPTLAPSELTLFIELLIDERYCTNTEFALMTGLRVNWVNAARADELELEEVTRWHVELLGDFAYPELPINEAMVKVADVCGLPLAELLDN